MQEFDLVIVGGGIVGLATAFALRDSLGERLLVLEAEAGVARHQTGHNSGVIHSGLYYKPGSLKARNCVAGRDAMYRFCVENGVRHERCGKIVVACSPEEVAQLDELERRGRGNGLTGLKRLRAEDIAEYEPHATGLAGLFVGETGIVHYPDVARVLMARVQASGCQLQTSSAVTAVRRETGALLVESTGGAVRAKALINAAGLHSDRVARLCGLEPGVRILPFRGEYYELHPERHHLVRNLIYPTPDPQFPFLGVHFTRMIHGGVEAGPNAVLALKREGYRRSDVSLTDLADMAAFGGAWRMAARYWRQGAHEYWRSFSKAAFVTALKRLVPAIEDADVRPAGAGVRAQAVEPTGKLVDDFRIIEGDRMVHVLNAPSPAATASLSIGETIAQMACARFGWRRPVSVLQS
ncbi:MAG: L-2-hydroxyglutarate oxidase [Vicinamibacterales bacterium]